MCVPHTCICTCMGFYSTIHVCVEAKDQHELLSMFFEIPSLNQECPVSATLSGHGTLRISIFSLPRTVVTDIHCLTQLLSRLLGIKTHGHMLVGLINITKHS